MAGDYARSEVLRQTAGYWPPSVLPLQLTGLVEELGTAQRVSSRLQVRVGGLVDRLLGLGVPTPELAARFEERPTWSE